MSELLRVGDVAVSNFLERIVGSSMKKLLLNAVCKHRDDASNCILDLFDIWVDLIPKIFPFLGHRVSTFI